MNALQYVACFSEVLCRVDTRASDIFSCDRQSDSFKTTLSLHFANRNAIIPLKCFMSSEEPKALWKEHKISRLYKSVKTPSPLTSLPVWLDFCHANFSNKHTGVHFHRCHTGRGCMGSMVPVGYCDKVSKT